MIAVMPSSGAYDRVRVGNTSERMRTNRAAWGAFCPPPTPAGKNASYEESAPHLRESSPKRLS